MRRKKLLTALLILALSLALAGEAGAEESLDRLERGLPSQARDVLAGESLDGSLDVGAVMERLLNSALDALSGIFRDALKCAGAIFAAAMLTSVAAPLLPKSQGGIDYVNLIGAAAILTAGVGGAASLIGEAAEVITELTDFSKLLLPVMASASAVSGAAASAAAKYAASSLFLSLLMTLGQKVILPMIYLYLAASAGEAAFGGCGGIAKLLSKGVTRLLTLVALAFTLYLTVTGLIASSADAAAVKLTKTAISTLLPVVGGMISDAADAVASGMGVVRACAGAVGVVSVLAVCLAPFLKLAVTSALIRAAATVSETVAGPRLSALMEALATAHTLALALAGTHAAILTVSVAAAARAVGG